MAFFEKIIFYFILFIGLLLFLKLDSRISLINRVLIAVVATIILLLLFIFISAIITMVVSLVILVLILSFLERKNISFRRLFKK